MYLKDLKKFMVAVFAMVLALAFVACKSNVIVEKAVDESAGTQINEEEIVLTIETVDISDIENGKTYQEIKYPIVEYKNNSAMKKSIDELNAKEKTEAEKFKEENKTNIREFIKEFKEESAEYSYDSSTTCTHHSDKYLSLLNNIYTFTMGAHGGTIVSGYTYDIKTGKKLTLKDFIKDMDELKKFLKEWVKNQKDDIFYPEAGETIDKCFNGEYELQFALVGKELRVYFQEYDIAPHAAGIIEVSVDKNLLKVDLNDI